MNFIFTNNILYCVSPAMLKHPKLLNFTKKNRNKPGSNGFNGIFFPDRVILLPFLPAHESGSSRVLKAIRLKTNCIRIS